MTKIVLASILKPVNDTRMYGKLAKTIAEIPNSEIHIIGFKSIISCPNETNINFYPVFDFKRLSFLRLFSSFIFIQLVFKIKPQTIIISTHELLFPSLLYGLFFKSKLIYDVRENYFYNIIYSNSFPYGIRFLIAYWVRFREMISSPFITQYILAEQCYLAECSQFVKKDKSIILENKFEGESRIKSDFSIGKGFKLVYSGTIASMYGVWETIFLTQKLHDLDPEITLQIIGYGTDKKLIENIKTFICDKPFITLSGGSELVPHKSIVNGLLNADLAVLSYQKNNSTINKIPTKLYECLALSVPMLLPNYAQKWIDITLPFSASIALDFNRFDVEKVYQTLLNTRFYSSTPPKDSCVWEGERLVECLIRLNNLI